MDTIKKRSNASLASKTSRENVYGFGSRPPSPPSKIWMRPSSGGRKTPERDRQNSLSSTKLKSASDQNQLRGSESPSRKPLEIIQDKEFSVREDDDENEKELPEVMSNATGSVGPKLQRTLATKKREFMATKKKFTPQQTQILEMFMSLKDIERKCIALGYTSEDTSLPKNMTMVDCGDWNTFDLVLLKDGKKFTDVASAIGNTLLNEMHNNLRGLPDNLISLSAQLMSHRQNFIDWLKSKAKFPNYPNFGQELKAKILELSDETQKLHEMISVSATESRKNVEKALDLAKYAWVDREDMIKRVEQLQKELHMAHQNIKNLTSSHERLEVSKKMIGDEVPVQKTEPRQPSEDEKRLCKVLREKLTNAEGTIRIAKAKIADLEKDLKESNNKTLNISNRVKELESQLRQRETCFELRSRKLQEVSKAGESTVESLTKQRDALEIRVKELQNELAKEKAEILQKEQDLKATLDSAQSRTQAEIAAKRAAQEKENQVKEELAKNEALWQSIKAHCDKILALQKENRTKLLPGPQQTPNEREVELYEELEATREALIKANEEIRSCKEDKDRFLETLAKIASCENNGTVHEKMASEILEKEKNITRMSDKIISLEEEKKKKEQLIAEYERKISELRMTVLKLQNYELGSHKTPHEDLQQQLLELHLQVTKLTRERNDLKKQSIRSALMLERHETAIEKQHQMLDLKEHLQTLLRNKSTLKSQAEIRAHLSCVCNTASKTWSLIEVYANKQKNLEDVIMAQNNSLSQQNRIRVELERTKAALMKRLLDQNHHYNR